MILDFADLSSEYVTATVGGVEHQFPMLKRGQIGKLMTKWAATDRAVLLRQCKEADATSAELLTALRIFDADAKLLSYFVVSLADVAHAQEVLTESLGAAGELEIHPRDMKDLALHVAGFGEFVTEPVEGEQPNPKE